MDSPFSTLATELAALQANELRRTRRLLETPQGVRVRVDGRDYVAFCSNDYLGLASHPALIEAAREGAARYGVGAGASHLVLGHTKAHHDLEEALAAFVGLPRALLFSTGYMANMGVVSALVDRGDAVFADRLNHASLNDAALLARAHFRRYPHGNLVALEAQLAASRARRKLIVTDAVFSMDGDLVDLPGLLDLCQRHDAWLLLDDAHGFGVLGRGGRGTLAHYDLKSPRVIYMATLGKAAGVFGAFVAGETDLVETLVQRARPYVYTTAAPPLLAHALARSLELIEREEWRRERLRALVGVLRGCFEPARWRLAASATPIQPLIMGGNPAIRPPTVPRGTARLRISLSAAHEVADVERLARVLAALQ